MAVNLPPIIDLVKSRFPFIGSVADPDAAINVKLAEAFAEMAPNSKKVEPDLFEESTYSPGEKIFFGAYVAYKLLLARVAAINSGDGTAGNVGTGNKLVTEATVDVLTAKFDIIKSSDKDLGIDTASLIEVFQTEVCTLARPINYSLPFCGIPAPKIPFVFLPDC